MKIVSLQRVFFMLLVFIIVMLLCRIQYSGSMRYSFLLWNLFLAWIPFRLSLYLAATKRGGVKAWAITATWLLFFPNALYIITDLVHLGANTNVPVWYDAILIFTAAITGLMMAFASLYNAERFFRDQFTKPTAEKLALACLFLGSFGVYLGRFLRWNSWDVLVNPTDLLEEIAVRFLFPINHYRTWAITCLLTAMFALLYLAGKSLREYNVPIAAGPLNN